MNPGDKGTRFERKAMLALEAQGYQVHRCVRTAVRQDAGWVTIAQDIFGCIDLIAKKRGGGEPTRWIQVTAVAGGLSKKRKDLALVDWDDAYDSVEIWIWTGGKGRRDCHFQVYRRRNGYKPIDNDRVYAVRRAARGAGRAGCPVKAMLFNLVEGSDLHRDVCYLMEKYGQPMHTAIETAVRQQATLTRRLVAHQDVCLGGGPPYHALHFLEDDHP